MRRTPVFKLTALAAALLAPVAAAALGLGPLTVQSSLGQPLSARIEVTAATPPELEALAVRVADPTLYRQNNLTYAGILARTRVTLERGGNGEPYLRVSTVGPVADPYLDLMVELNWSSGRLVRSYTFLLDPPGVLPPPVEPVTPARSGNATMRGAAAAPAPAPAQAGAGPESAGGSLKKTVGAGERVEVQRGDTLSKLAEDLRPAGVTLDQMLVALFDSNQDAFERGNFNRLRAGSILNVPTAEVAAATPAEEASRIVRMQAADWQGYRDRVATTVPTVDTEGTRATSGTIGTAVVAPPPEGAPRKDRLQVSRQVGAAGASAGEAEDIVARERQIREAQARIAELEKTLAELKRVVEIKSQSLAQKQSEVGARRTEAPKAAEPAPDEAPRAADAPKAAVAVAPTVADGANPAEPPRPEPPKAAETPKAAEPPKTVPVAPKAPPAANQGAPKSFVEDVMANTPTWAIGGSALAVLAGLAVMLVARRRRSAVVHDNVRSPVDLKTRTVFTSTGGAAVNTGGQATTTGEFSREGFGNIDTDEVDPIAEAEVYLAYGRDAQAEEILRHALRRDAQRQEIYLKLLEIHAQHNKPSAFEAVAAELLAVCDGEGETWQKAVALGRELDPKNPLFAAPGQPVAAPSGGAAAGPAVDQGLNARLDDELAALAGNAVRPRAPAVAVPGAREPAKPRPPADFVAPVAAPAEPPEIKRHDAGTLLEFDSSPVVPRAPAPQPRVAAQAETIDFSKLALSLEMPEPRAELAKAPSVLDAQWHDVATKLDLAKAYQEMGDIQGARELLREVALEGDPQQAAEAATLLGQLG